MVGAASRPRNAAATRAAILASARAAFARAGYDGVGVREIAQGAGVTAMLINRYFGSKERLFAEVVSDTMNDPVILTTATLASDDPGAAIAKALVALTRPEAAPLDGFMVLLNSASSPRANEISREQIGLRHHRNLSGALSGDLAAERSALVLAIVAGVQVMRQLIALPALADADPKDLESLLTPIMRQLTNDQPRGV